MAENKKSAVQAEETEVQGVEKLSALGAVVQAQSQTVTNILAGINVPVGNIQGPVTKAKDGISIGATDSAGSVYRILNVRSDAIIDVLEVLNAAQAGSTAFNIGVYNTIPNGGAALNASLFGSVDLSVVRNGSTGRFNARYNGSAGLATMGQPLWSVLGLTLDPNCTYNIALTSVTQGAAGGQVNLIAEMTYFGWQS